MSRYRLYPTSGQEALLLSHCAHARFVRNLAVDQGLNWHQGRSAAPRFAEQCRQLTEARAEFEWLRAGSASVQQQASRDYQRALSNFFAGTHRRPTFHKAGRDEGFRVVGPMAGRLERVSKHQGRVWVPKTGWVTFRWSRRIPGAKSYRVTRDRAGRWHLAFAAVPDAIPAPGNGASIGVDRGVAVSAALSNGDMGRAPGLRLKEAERLQRLKRRLQ